MNTLLYFCYGDKSIFREAIFSILSLQQLPVDKSTQIVVYSDRPEAFAALGVKVRTLTEAKLSEWMGATNYIHRRKLMAVIDALERYGGSVAFIDCDTYFQKPAGLLFKMIGPGRSCLHIAEGRLKETRTRQNARISHLIESGEFHDLSGKRLVISPDAMVWNSGVLGVHSSDLPLMQEALNLCDQLWKQDQITEPAEERAHTLEQFAVGVFLARNKLSAASNIVFHYWRPYLRGPFAKKLEEGGSDSENVELAGGGEYADKFKPRETIKNALKVFVRTWVRRVGGRVSGLRTST
jgi:hypothetical protein